MKPEVSIPVALATAAVVVGVFQVTSPSFADVRTIGPGSMGESILGSSERTALLVSAGAAGAISLIAKDPVPFWIGGLMAVALSWAHRYARAVDPTTNKLPVGQLAGARYAVQAQG